MRSLYSEVHKNPTSWNLKLFFKSIDQAKSFDEDDFNPFQGFHSTQKKSITLFKIFSLIFHIKILLIVPNGKTAKVSIINVYLSIKTQGNISFLFLCLHMDTVRSGHIPWNPNLVKPL